MTTIKRFEDLHCWQSARELVNMVYETTRQSPFSRDFGLCDQIRRAAVSVMSNIAEGFTAATDREFMRFLSYARRSISEVQAQAYIALDQKYITREIFDKIYGKANETEKQVNAFIAYLNKSSHSVKELASVYALDLQDAPDREDFRDL